MQVAFVGAGTMAQAISKGARAAHDGWDFVFYDKSSEGTNRAAQNVGGHAVPEPAGVAEADLIVLAVKPQHQSEALKDLPATNACLVSIAAGRSLGQIEQDLRGTPNADASVIRTMPNLNATVGQSATAICANKNATKDQVQQAQALFKSVGITQDLPENLFGVFAAMAGCSPAWFFAIVDHLASAGVKHGLTKEQAIKAVTASMAGSATLLTQTLHQGGSAASLIDQVCSPGGTTIAGLLAAESRGLGPALVDAVDAAIMRDEELGS